MIDRPEALFFDLDGTLADTEHLHWESWRDVVAGFGAELDWPTYERIAVGIPDVSIAGILSRHFQFPLDPVDEPAVVERKKVAFRLGLERAMLVPEANVELIRAVSEWPKAVVTMSTETEARAILERAGILGEFQALVFFEDVVEPKPHPEPYQLAMRRLGVEGGLAFEDSKRGLASAAAAGLEVIRVGSPGELAALGRGRLIRR